MNKIISFEASIGTNENEKIVWEYTLVEHLFGGFDNNMSHKSEKEYDTEEEAAVDLFKTLNYILSGTI